MNGSDIELDNQSDDDDAGQFYKDDTHQPSNDKGKNGVESSALDDEDLEVSSHSTEQLDPKKVKKVICHNEQFEQPDFQWSHFTSKRDTNVSAISR